MPDMGSANIEITVKGVDKLRQRLEAQGGGARKMWFRKCECACGCPIQHPGLKPECSLCRNGDHWTRVVETLDRVMKRKES